MSCRMPQNLTRFASLILILFSTVTKADCPQTSPEFMRHLGRSMIAADRLVMDAKINPSAVSQSRIDEAVAGLDLAIRCSELTLQDCGLALLPARLHEKPESYRGFMREFVHGLRDYRQAIARLPEGMDAETVLALKEKIRELVNLAHSLL
jgi:hypothetical protein